MSTAILASRFARPLDAPAGVFFSWQEMKDSQSGHGDGPRYNAGQSSYLATSSLEKSAGDLEIMLPTLQALNLFKSTGPVLH